MEEKLNDIIERLKRIERTLDRLDKRYYLDHCAESDARDFAINVAANIVGNAIKTPTIINI